MRRPTFPAVTTAAALAMATGSTGAALAEAYQLDFEPPREVGTTFQMRAQANSMQEVFTRVNGQTVEEQATYIEGRAHANCEVLAVNEHGGVSQMAYELIEYEFELDSEPFELDTDRRLIATADDDGVTFAYEGGGAIDEAYFEALSLIFDLPMDTENDGPDTNRMMNAGEPREVGDEWEMDHAYMVETLAEEGQLLIDEDDISSHVTLVAVQPNDAGVQMAHVESDMTADKIDLPAGQFPDFLKVTDSGMRVRITGTLSLDPAALYGSQQAEMEMAFLVKGKTPDGQVVEIEVEFEREAEAEFMPIAG